MTLDLEQALDIIIARTGHHRYRELCDPDHPAYDPAYVRYVLDRAAGPEPTRPRPVAPPPTPAIPLAGDLVAALTAKIGADRAAKWVATKLGKDDCGCGARRAKLNALDAKVRAFLGLGKETASHV